MILADYQVNGQAPSKVATSGTAAVYFPRLLGPNFGVAPSTPTATNATGQLYLPGSQYFAAANGARLRAVASGAVYVGATSLVTVTIQANTGSLTTPSYTTLATVAQSVTGPGRASFMLEAHMVIAGHASLSTDLGTGLQANFGSPAPLIAGQLSGWYAGILNNLPAPVVIVTSAATTNPWNWLTSGLVVLVTFATGNAANAATLNEFVVLAD